MAGQIIEYSQLVEIGCGLDVHKDIIVGTISRGNQSFETREFGVDTSSLTSLRDWWQPKKKSQKNIDARWTQKGGQKFFGYKNHTKDDARSKLIDTYEVTDAAIHDSQATEKLLREEDRGQELYADSAYIGKPIDKMLKAQERIPQIIERAFKGKPLTDEQKESNRIKSKTRCRVEHIFGFVTNSMNDFFIQAIGFQRAKLL